MKPRKPSFFPPLIISISLLSTVNVFSQVEWTGNSDSNWTLNTNWNGDIAPVTNDDVVIDSNAANQPAINSTVDLGSGTLTIGDTNASGTNTSLLLGAGGDLTSASVTLAAGADSSGSLLIGNGGAAGTLTSIGGLFGGLGDASIIFNHSDATYDFSTDISGNLSIFHQGSGTTILSGTNTFTGDTNLLSGVLAIDSNARLGDAANQIIFDGGTLRLDGSFDLERTMVLNAGGGSLDAGVNDMTLSGDISGIGSLSLDSQGTLTFAGTNKTHSGTTSLLQGTLLVTDSDGLSANSALALSPGTLVDASATATQTVAGLSGSGDLVLGSGAFSVNSASGETFSGIISGNGSLSKSGSGVLTLAGTNTYLGGTLIEGTSGGGISISSNDNLGDSASGLSFSNGGTLQITAGVTSARNVTLDGGSSFQTTAGASVFSGDFTGSGGLIKSGSGSLSLTGNNTYLGDTSILSGTLVIDSEARLGDNTNQIIFDGGSLRVDDVIDMQRSMVLNAGGGTIDSGSNDITFSNNISGTGALTLSSEGTLTFAGTNKTYSGTTSLVQGTLIVQESDGLSATSALALSAGTSLDASATATQTVAGLSGSGGLVLGSGEFSVNSAANGTFSGIISGAGSLLKTGAGMLTLQGVNTYAGGTSIDGTGGGGISISSNTNLGAVEGGLSFSNGGTLRITSSINSARDVVLDGGSIFRTNNGISTLSGEISGSGGLTKTGTGTLNLTGVSTYTGGTFVNEGKLLASKDEAFGDLAGNIQLADGTTFGSSASFATSRTLTANGSSVYFEAATDTTFTIGGAITGTAGIYKIGSGTVLLNGVGLNDYAGDTIVSQGTLRAGAAGVFNSTSNVLLGNGTNLNLDGHNQTIRSLSGFGSVLLGSGTLTTDTPDNTTYSGVMSGTGGLEKSGSGTLTLLNTTSSYSGGTTINGGGTLIIAGNVNLGAAAGGLVLDGGTLKLKSDVSLNDTNNRAITLGTTGGTFDTSGRTWSLNGVISGDGSLTKSGSGTLVLSNSGNTYQGGTFLNTGAIQLSSDGALGNASGNVTLGGGRLIVNGTVTSARDFVGSGALIKEGTGTLHLTGTSNTYTGGTIVNQGVLRFNDDASLGGVSSPVTLNGGSLSAAATLSGTRNLTLSANSQFEVLSSHVATWNGQINGNYTLTKTGSGTLVAAGNNQHKGFDVYGGTLQISSDANIGGAGSSVSVYGGTLRFGASGTFTKDIKLGSATLDTAGNDVTLSIKTADYSHYTVTKTGAGSLTVLSSSKTGTFQVAQGTLKVGASGALANHSQINLSGSGSSLDLNGFNTNIQSLAGISGSTVSLGSNTLTIQSGSGTYSGSIVGTGSLVKTGSYTQTLSGTNSYSGGTIVSGGSLIFGTSSAVPVSGAITNTAYTGAGFAMDQAFLDRFNKAASTGVLGIQTSTANNLSLAGFSSSASFGTNATGVNVSGDITPQGSTYRFVGGYGQINLSSNLSGARDLYVGALRVNLSGTNTLSNGITAGSDGVVVFQNASALPAAGNLKALSNGYIGSVMPVDQTFLNLFDKANTQGVIGLNSNSSNNLDLTGFGSQASLGTFENVTISGTITPQGTNYRFGGVSNAPKGTMTVQSNLTGSRGLDIGYINLILTGSNNYSGITTISSGGSVQVDNDSRFGTGKLVLNYSTYLPTASFSSSREIQIIESGTINTGWDVTLTQNGNITGNGHLSKEGPGTVILNGNDALSGATVNGGVLRLASANAISSNASLYTNYGGTAELAGVSRTINYLDQWGGVVDLGSANLTINSGNLYNGQIQGTGSLVKTSAGTLYIQQTNIHSGGTVLQQGNTYIQSSAALGTGTLTLSGGTLNNNSSYSLALANNVAVTVNSSIMTGYGQNSGMTFEGSLSGSGNIIKTGSGSMTLSGNSSHSGTITVSDGTLRLTGSTSSGLIANTSTSLITGDGSTAGLIAVSNGGMVSPGNSPGTLGAGGLQLGAGGIYNWEIAGVSAPNYDSISVSGNINITATAFNPFVIRVIGLDGSNNPGFVSGFDMASTYMWILASGSSISGFDTAKFELDLSAFHNPADAEQFTLSRSGNNLVLNYNAPPPIPVPEPSSALLAVLGTGALLIRRKRRD